MKEKKEELILAAAGGLFSYYGIKKTTVEDIAKKAKIGKGTIYSYFKSKEDIFEAFIDAEVSGMEGKLNAEIENPVTASGKLKAFVKFHMNAIKKFSGFFPRFHEEYLEYYGYIEKIRKKYDKEEQEQIEKILTWGVEIGEFEISDVKLTAFTLLVAMKGMEFHWGGGYKEGEADSKIETMMNILFKGIERK